MGYMKEKYTKAYYLKKDEHGQDTIYGVEGLSEFKNGDIRQHDKDLLSRLEYKGKSVLDIGFGRGEALKYASDHGAGTLVGVDFSEDAYAIAKNFLDQYGIKADLYCQEAINFLNDYVSNSNHQKFDIVMMLDCVEHIPRNELTQILNLLSQCLSSRGIIAINTPVFKVDNDVIAEGLNPKARDTSDDFEETAGMHCNRYTKSSLKKYMKKLGFKAISGHFFVNFLPIYSFLEGTKKAWRKAYNLQYPILLSAIEKPEFFEYVIPQEEIERLEKKQRQKGKIINLVKKVGGLSKTSVKKGLTLIKKLLKKDKKQHILNKESRRDQSSWETILDGPLKNYEMFLDVESPAYWHRKMVEGKYDAFIYQTLEKYVTKGTVIWDVGAHVGYHSLAFAALVGSEGKVVTFEPNPFNIDYLHQNFARNLELSKRIVLFPYALSNHDGQASFIFSKEVDNGQSSGSHLSEALVPEDNQIYSNFQEKLVTTIKADTLIKEDQSLIPSIIKIDVEGAENIVLEGAKEILFIHKPLLIIEVHNITMMFYVQNLLFEMGYKLNIIDDKNTSLSRCFILAETINNH